MADDKVVSNQAGSPPVEPGVETGMDEQSVASDLEAEESVPAVKTVEAVAAEALRDRIWEDFIEVAQRELEGLTLWLKSTEDEETSRRWEFDFKSGKKIDDKFIFDVDVDSPEVMTDVPLAIEMSLSLEKLDNEESYWLKLGVRRGGYKGRSKKFRFLSVKEIDGEIIIGGSAEEVTPNYSGRNVNENVKEVWFPNDASSEKGSLEIPLIMSYIVSGQDEAQGSPHDWPVFTEEGLKIALPSIDLKADRAESGREVEQISIELDTEKAFHAGLSFAIFWLVCNVYGGEQASLRDKGWASEDDPTTVKDVFPGVEEFRSTRPVDLAPAEVIDELREDEFYFPWHVVESACAALNAGKHVIFTGPPGCGKSKLSTFLAKKATGTPALMATASPAWTSGDLIGRYLPKKGDEHGLVFREGFFLRALGRSDDTDGGSQPSRWLIIDEFNRADIDACFGELFSVLAGDLVELPFEKTVEVDGETEEVREVERFVRIIQEDQDAESDADYRVPRRFRLIGTMNDADRSGLNDLSFALMRRFAIIPVEPPETSTLSQIIENTIQRTTEQLKLDKDKGKHAWRVGDTQSGKGYCTLEAISDEIHRLFANSSYSGGRNWRREKRTRYSSEGSAAEVDERFTDLVAEKVVGVSVVQDVIRFVGEGLRAGTDNEGDPILVGRSKVKDMLPDTTNKSNTPLEEYAEQLALSYLAMAVVLQVFPQLEALAMGTERGENQLFSAIWHIFWAFHTNDAGGGKVEERDPEELLMLRVTRSETSEGYELQSDQKLSEFLFQNLLTRFPHIGEEQLLRHLDPWLPDESD